MAEIWKNYQQHDFYGMYAPGWFFRNGAQYLDTLGDTDNCRAFLEAAYAAYNELVDRIREPEWIQSFSATPVNRIILELRDLYGVSASQ